MKTRILYTRFWKDSFVHKMTSNEKLIYNYLLTNDKVNIIHCYELLDDEIIYDLAVSKTVLAVTKKLLEEKRKVFFKNGWIYLYNADKYENYGGSKNELAKEKLLQEMNSEIKKWYLNLKNTPIDTPIKGVYIPPINHNTEIRNNNRGIVKGGILDPQFLEYIKTFNEKYKSEYRPTKSMEELYKARLVTFSHEEILKALGIMHKNPFYRGSNNRNWKATPEFLIAKDEKIDEFLNQEVKTKEPVKFRFEGGKAIIED